MCFLKEIRFFSSLSRSSTRKWPCTENWSFLLGTSRSAAPHSGRKCTRQEPKAVKWPVRHTKNLLPSQGRRLLALFGNLYTGCMNADRYLWWPRPQRWTLQIWCFNQSPWSQNSLESYKQTIGQIRIKGSITLSIYWRFWSVIFFKLTFNRMDTNWNWQLKIFCRMFGHQTEVISSCLKITLSSAAKHLVHKRPVQ